MTQEELYDQMYSSHPANDVDIEEEVLFKAAQERLRPGGRILDVGCGAGNLARRLSTMGFEITGIDHSPVAANLAAKNGVDCRVVDVDKQELPFEDAIFDAAWAGDVIEHVFDPIGMLRKIQRVLRPGGLVFISVPNELPLRTRCRVFLNGNSIQTYVYNRFEISHHHTHFTENLIELVVRKANLTPRWLGGVIRFPLTKREMYSRDRRLCRWFGRTFILLAEKNGN